MSTRKLDFPDHKDPSFDPDAPFEADNGQTYVWNGYGWELVCAEEEVVEPPVQMVYWGVLPKEAPAGALWTDQDTYKQFVYNGNEWVEITSCTGDGEGGTPETPWIRIDEMRVLRQYSGISLGSDQHVTKVLIADYHYNDHYAGTITDEWEWDENGDGNWVTYDPRTDSNVDSRLDDYLYFYYRYSCEAGSGYPEMDPAHPHPCAKIRVRLINTWDDGQSEKSEWFEVWLAKEQNPAMNYPYQPPSVCSGGRSSKRKRARNADGTYRADDPATPDIDEAWEQ